MQRKTRTRLRTNRGECPHRYERAVTGRFSVHFPLPFDYQTVIKFTELFTKFLSVSTKETDIFYTFVPDFDERRNPCLMMRGEVLTSTNTIIKKRET